MLAIGLAILAQMAQADWMRQEAHLDIGLVEYPAVAPIPPGLSI